ncbi:unnamed protein product [Litomosoides sigmodontis]|uniref:G-protein coupled receptors family 1 profile domain-containing protein n=1 Tax=Litomosoides sigmodontis TaxID=42156 RepID=A0A3P6URW3_LITSI|nr:unnamed protein product [Litomosoides sigmodontis]
MSVTWDQEAVQELYEPSQTTEAPNIFAILFLLLLCATGLLGNLLVCMAIKFNRRLQNIPNYLLFSLTLTDLFVCGLVMPISIAVEVHQGMWMWSFLMCLLYVYADVFFCTASIVHMSAISIDRYLGISKPLKARDKSKTSIVMKLASVWIATILISCPIAIMALIDSRNIFDDNICRITNRYYMIYGSTSAFLIPLLIMVITYVRTTSLLKQQPTVTGHQGTASNNYSEAFTLRRTYTQRTYTPENLQNVIPFERNKEIIKPMYSREQMEMAIRVLAIIFACFFICWTPFFGANLAFGFCGERCALPPTIESFFIWLGQFRRTIFRVLRCQCTHSIRNTYAGSYYSRRMATNDRLDSQREVHDLSYNKNLEKRKFSQQKHSAQSVQTNSSLLATSRISGLPDKNAYTILNRQTQNTLKTTHLMWKGTTDRTIGSV